MITTPDATPQTLVDEALLRQMAAEIREEIPGAEVRLFGSWARGDAGASSDVDLMITVSDDWYATHNRFEVLGDLWNKLARHRVPLDLLLYPRSKVEERRHWLSHVIAQAHREGRVLAGRT
ncbi:MAG: nucleotidyltransferase domain-containing protein [Cyanobium sp.]